MLPDEAYDSARYFRQERDQLFKPKGMAIGPLTLADVPGSFQAIDLFDDPVLLMRDDDGHVGLYSRLCRHQFAEIVRTDGRADQLICPLHGWVYGKQGQFKGLAGRPLSDEGREDCDLKPYPLEERNGILHAGMAPLPSREGWQPISITSSKYRFLESRSVGLNWKQVMERGLQAGATLRDLNLMVFPDGLAITVLPKFPGSSLVNIATENEGPDLHELDSLFSPRTPEIDPETVAEFHEMVSLP